jgi:HKD family nuclease
MKYSLEDLNKGIIFTGQVSEVHIKSMKMYPFIFIDDVASASLEYEIDLVSGEKPGVSKFLYTLGFKNDKIPSTLEEGAKNLQKALSVLFMSKNVELKLLDNNNQVLAAVTGEQNGK